MSMEIICYKLADGSTVIAKHDPAKMDMEDPCDVRVQVMQVGPDPKRDVQMQPFFTPINTFGVQRFPNVMDKPHPDHIMWSYPANPQMADVYLQALQELAARAAGIVDPNSNDGRATLQAVRRNPRQ